MSSYIDPAPQGDPKATGAYSVAIAAQTGAEGRDSAGNLAVDYVWGSRPLQPDTERLDSIADVTANVYGASPDVPSGGKQSFSVSNISGISIGDSFDITGASPYTLNTSYVVETIYPSSPTGGVLVTTTPNGIYGTWMPTEMPTLTKSTSDNVGGGAGDKSWSKTTKKKSVKLDPTLDGHNIATEFWNNFPGYTPNAGFVPQELFRFTTTNTYSVAFQPDSTEDDPYYRAKEGFIINITNGGASAEDRTAIKELISAGSLAGQRVPAIQYLDTYLNAQSTPEGWIVGADYSPDNYGGYNLTIQVQTAANAFQDISVVYPAAGTEIVFGVGTAKSVLWQGVNGVDYSWSVIDGGAAYGAIPGFSIRGSQYGGAQTDMSELVALVNSGALVDAYIGVGVLNENSPYISGNAYFSKFNILKIDSASVSPDGYGNYVVDVRANTFGWDSSYQNFSEYDDGTTLVIIK